MKAIETRYAGYFFRSRQEARHAVFFDTLGIVYRYEYEGYDLEGIFYLPDFYLPQLDCFVEIKAQEPTAEERIKTKLLALHSGKRVYTFYGDLWFPEEAESYHGICDEPPYIEARSATDPYPETLII